MRLTPIVLLTLALAGVGPASAAESTNDVRCLVAISRLVDINAETKQLSQEAAQTTALLGTMYFMGKLEGRDPRLNIEDAMVAEVSKMTVGQLQSELIRCGGEMRSVAQKWDDIGKNLVKRGQELQKQQKAPPQNP